MDTANQQTEDRVQPSTLEFVYAKLPAKDVNRDRQSPEDDGCCDSSTDRWEDRGALVG